MHLCQEANKRQRDEEIITRGQPQDNPPVDAVGAQYERAHDIDVDWGKVKKIICRRNTTEQYQSYMRMWNEWCHQKKWDDGTLVAGWKVQYFHFDVTLRLRGDSKGRKQTDE